MCVPWVSVHVPCFLLSVAFRVLAAHRCARQSFLPARRELPAPGSGGGAPGALHALRHLSFGCSDDALRDGPDRLPRFLAQVAALPGLKVLDVTDDYGMHHEEALAAALPAVAVDFYRLGCE